MGFVGAVNRLGSLFVRPHDVVILHGAGTRRRGGDDRAIVHLGFEVRVELVLGEGEKLRAQLTRPRATSSSSKGQIVYARPSQAKVFDNEGERPVTASLTTEELQAA